MVDDARAVVVMGVPGAGTPTAGSRSATPDPPHPDEPAATVDASGTAEQAVPAAREAVLGPDG
ncbi:MULTISPECIES: hypothetical protein [unclassified Streptomyces]|uniref:hypothetical protein n=1 Tax=unclassified Streptomyces TaxID=2593676 RepID=UPI001F045025|nr:MULTISPECIES: hypothetical protein [unclassified Streptomyces]MCH0563919.1 hypothetical protein [Streptomyces sp. MUM 2J]MCH0570686.1 hypothetical protein [Streptomyces sp. MUM 136J]